MSSTESLAAVHAAVHTVGIPVDRHVVTQNPLAVSSQQPAAPSVALVSQDQPGGGLSEARSERKLFINIHKLMLVPHEAVQTIQ